MKTLKQRRSIIVNEIWKHLKRVHPDTNCGKGDARTTRILNDMLARVERIYQTMKGK